MQILRTLRLTTLSPENVFIIKILGRCENCSKKGKLDVSHLGIVVLKGVQLSVCDFRKGINEMRTEGWIHMFHCIFPVAFTPLRPVWEVAYEHVAFGSD